MFNIRTTVGTSVTTPSGDSLTVTDRTAFNDGSARLHLLRVRPDGTRRGEVMHVDAPARERSACYCDYAYHPKGH